MGYYIRAFCTSTSIPALADVIKWTDEQGYPLQVEPEDGSENAEIPELAGETIGVLYKDGKLPFLVELNRRDGEGSLCQEEIEEFLEFLEDVRKSKKKERVIQHLGETQYTVACQIPTSNFDDDGYWAVTYFLHYFVVHCGGMVQADNEGFYNPDNNKILIEMEE